MVANQELSSDADSWSEQPDVEEDEAYLEQLFSSPESAAPHVSFRAAAVDRAAHVREPELPQLRGVEFFSNFNDAREFLRLRAAYGDNVAYLSHDINGLAVHFSLASSASSIERRANRRRAGLEERFIVRQYLNWAPIGAIALAVGRSEQMIETWLTKRGLIAPQRNSADGIGELTHQRACSLCDELKSGRLHADSLVLLHGIGVLLEALPTLAAPQTARPMYTATLSVADKRRVVEFALDYERLDVAYRFALEAGENRQALLLALQDGNHAAALEAIATFSAPPPHVETIRCSALQCVRDKVRTKVAEFLVHWPLTEARRRSDYGYAGRSDAIETELPAALFKLAVAVEVHALAPELRTLYYFFARDEMLATQARDGDAFAAWALADHLRKTIHQRVLRQEDTSDDEQNLRRLESGGQAFSLNLARMISLLNAAMPLDVSVPVLSKPLLVERLKASFLAECQAD